MKTLDEVITKYEMCSSQITCSTCPYSQEICSCDSDALHYLKEYREKMNILKVRIAEYKRGFEQLGVEWARIKDNLPLTWDELRTMEGKPVWIDSVPLVRRWVIIKKFHPIGGNNNLFDMEVEDGAHFLRKSMGRDAGAWWQAYRKERS